MLSPKRTKFRKQQRGRSKGRATRCTEISFGEFGLVALERIWITNRQIEAARIAITRHVKRGGKVWIRIFPDKPYTKKPAETRMGKGKGEPDFWAATVKPGTVLYELGGVTEQQARICFARLAHTASTYGAPSRSLRDSRTLTNLVLSLVLLLISQLYVFRSYSSKATTCLSGRPSAVKTMVGNAAESSTSSCIFRSRRPLPVAARAASAITRPLAVPVSGSRWTRRSTATWRRCNNPKPPWGSI